VLAIPGTDQKGIVDYIFDYSSFYNPSLFTIEDTAMSKPVFQAIRAEMRRRNDFSIGFKEEKPGNRMSKRDRIQEILAQRFAVGQIHLKKTQYDLESDTIDALAYACKYSYPPMNNIQDKKGNWSKNKPKAKSWIVA